MDANDRIIELLEKMVAQNAEALQQQAKSNELVDIRLEIEREEIKSWRQNRAMNKALSMIEHINKELSKVAERVRREK